MPFNNVSGVAAAIIVLVFMTVFGVLFVPGVADAQLKTICVQSVLLALAVLTGYYFNSSADQAKKADDISKAPKPQVDVPAQTIDVEPSDKVP